MNILFIGKYPPIEGGISSKMYWLTRELASVGHDVHVVTNAECVEEEYRINMTSGDRKHLADTGVKVYNTSGSVPSYIPYVRPDVALLANKALQVMRTRRIDVICSWYLLPYGVAGTLVSNITGIPHIARHAGSDISRLMGSLSLRHLLFEVLRQADLVMTDGRRGEQLARSGIERRKIFCERGLDAFKHSFFVNEGKKYELRKKKRIISRPVITYFGKMDQGKGIAETIKALSLLDKEYIFRVISAGNEDRFNRLLNGLGLADKARVKIKREGFVPPWRMPSRIAGSRCVIIPECGFPVPNHFSSLIDEVLSMGVCLVVSGEVYNNNSKINNLRRGKNVVVVNCRQPNEFAKVLDLLITDAGRANSFGKAGRNSRVKECYHSRAKTMIAAVNAAKENHKQR